ncbi:YdcH family protein [Rhizobium oryzicola]|uniref:YdcH family protein n=1 Tax=Rhizobium oryzicola TaxID=1232668 RepID=A0ABT8SZM5_9HYPH|nr:YdcH family protein [Rhizobium oryzicola]MDO1583907.1 YdcH family protein [Rhizobium oryzicola]
MSSTPHHLAEEFPDHLVQMRHLRDTDGHFHRIAREYEEVNHRVHKAETNVEPCDDFHMAELRKRRMVLKDEINGMLTRAEPLADEEA